MGTAIVDPRELKYRPSRALAYEAVEKLHPNMSPNVFVSLKEVLAEYPHPTVAESGIGISTYHLCEQLRSTGGRYVGIEHNRPWFEIVEMWIMRLLTQHAKDVPLEQSRRTYGIQPKHYPKPLLAIDSTFRAGPLAITLLLRQATGQTGDGTAEEFDDYLHALEQPADALIVDGRARVPTLTRIAEERLVRPGGLLFLHDAHVYRTAALEMFPGGIFLDGQGGFKNDLRPDQHPVQHVREEAYLWRAPDHAVHSDE